MKVSDFLLIEELTDAIYSKVRFLCDGKKLSDIKAIFPTSEFASNSNGSCEVDVGISSELPLYNGKDISLRNGRNQCQNYRSENLNCGDSGVLLLCNGCKMVKFCSRECQREYWSVHKEYCEGIQMMESTMESKRAEAIERMGVDAFEGENARNVWGNVFGRVYCYARRFVADAYFEMAHEEDYDHIYETGLAHYLELLRLNHTDAQGLRKTVPFVLIKLEREDDCYNFVKWWMSKDANGEHDWSHRENSEEGDWLWFTNQDRFENPSLLLESHPGSDSLAPLSHCWYSS